MFILLCVIVVLFIILSFIYANMLSDVFPRLGYEDSDISLDVVTFERVNLDKKWDFGSLENGVVN